ncbi:MAG: thioredoxin family protein [Desulfurococcales archaeon]|nr:thioredoxin family protein [Desulfurococcales archaeon]
MPPSTRCCSIGGEVPPGWDVRGVDDIDRIVEDCRIVFILFYSGNCKDCAEASESYIEVAEKYSGDAAFVRVNVDRLGEVATALGVRSVPSLMLVIDGEIVGYSNGHVDEDDLEDLVLEALRGAGCLNSSYYIV